MFLEGANCGCARLRIWLSAAHADLKEAGLPPPAGKENAGWLAGGWLAGWMTGWLAETSLAQPECFYGGATRRSLCPLTQPNPGDDSTW
eukprot:353323-Chlamydomonas_euryale.AAC.7